MVKVKKTKKPRVSQGDIIRNVEYIEHVSEKSGQLEISKIVFPLVVVLTQDWSYSQMLCMALGGDPFFTDTVNEFYSSDYFPQPLRMM
jgi:hypothetical protein